MSVHRGDGRGFGDPVQRGRNRDSDKTIIPFRSYRCGAESPETRCPYYCRTILRSRSQAGPVRNVQTAALRKGLRVVFYR